MTLPIYDEEVRAEAACETWPVRLFWPDASGGGTGKVPSTRAEADYMLRVCKSCPVQRLCLAVKPDNAVGVWGGYQFGELSPVKDSYVPVVIGRAALESRPGGTPSERVATRAREAPRPTTTQNIPRKPATRPRGVRRGDVARLVKAHGGASTTELVRLSGVELSVLRHHLYRLLADGRLRKERRPRPGCGPEARWYAA